MSISLSQKLRSQGLGARRRLTDEQRQSASLRIQRSYLASGLFYRAIELGCYIAAPDEVDTSIVFDRAWQMGKQIYAPVVGGDGEMQFVETLPNTPLIRNRFGLWEPKFGRQISAQKLGVVVTPTVAFDECARRIGTGGGFLIARFNL